MGQLEAAADRERAARAAWRAARRCCRCALPSAAAGGLLPLWPPRSRSSVTAPLVRSRPRPTRSGRRIERFAVAGARLGAAVAAAARSGATTTQSRPGAPRSTRGRGASSARAAAARLGSRTRRWPAGAGVGVGRCRPRPDRHNAPAPARPLPGDARFASIPRTNRVVARVVLRAPGRLDAAAASAWLRSRGPAPSGSGARAARSASTPRATAWRRRSAMPGQKVMGFAATGHRVSVATDFGQRRERSTRGCGDRARGRARSPRP